MTSESEITFFGIGSNSFYDLSTVSFTFTTDEQRILVDCGPSTPSDIYSAGFEFRDFDTLLITHRHPDHCLGASYFLFGRHLEVLQKSRQDPEFEPDTLEIISEPSVWEFVEQAFEFCHGDPDRSFEVNQVPIQSFEDGRDIGSQATMKTVEVNHTVPTRGFILNEQGENTLAYSSDTLLHEGFNEAAAGSNVVIHEAMVPHSEEGFSRTAKHATSEDAGKAIDQIGPQTAYLVHLRPSFSDQREKLENEAAEQCSINPVYPTPYESLER
ncbi:MBL fold metallo-hydrolase [Natrinema longum]|uniref:MBL fold metallo-hydrolase n=1 Tax=Natrinema longum TaxID=370324 RepID=UPI001CCEFB76|nr:MBL fold metallo-hydrolase [Natrinema longum]MBZ6497181.1 MBL fold metallo-hydrolase [Natrinema longum]